MGTRALFKVLDYKDREIVTVYIQGDGYPEGVPLEVAKYVAKRRLVNGFSPDIKLTFKEINGMDDMAAQLVAFLKQWVKDVRMELGGLKDGDVDGFPAGFVYVMPPGTRDVGEDYVYYLYPDPNYSKLLRKVWELEEKLPKLAEEGKDDEVEAVHELIYELERKMNVMNCKVFIKAVKVGLKGEEEVIFDGRPEEYVRKFSAKQ